MSVKSRFISIIVLMAVALLGLVTIQIYWIHSVIVERTVEFEGNVNKALRQISAQLTEDELDGVALELSKHSDFISSASSNIDLNYVKLNPERNEAINVIQNVKKESFTVPLNKYLRNYNDSLRISSYLTSSSVYKRPSYSEAGGPNAKYAVKYGWQEEPRLADYIMSVISIVGDKTPVEQRIDPEKLTGIIDEILSGNNINIPYQYGILDDGETTSIRSPQWDEDLYPYHTDIFSSQNRVNKYELVLRFPQEMNFVVRSMIPMIVATVLFVLFIVVVFATAVYQMFRQKKVSDMKYDFINNMTHEFKTPIATISIAADALNSERVNSDRGKVEHYAGIIKQENRRMLAQVESVLRIARLERGQMDLNRVQSGLNSLLEEALEHIELIVADRQGTIEERFEAEKDTATVDRMHLVNIFLNLLDNANKYSPGRPEITVRTYNTPDGRYWAVDISDKGMGMSKSGMKKIFENFYRIPTGDVHNIKGHGLGLAYSKKIVELHAGVIEVESAQGKGSTFTVKIPLD